MDHELTEDERAIWRAFTLMRRRLDLSLERRLQAAAGISGADYEILRALADEATRQLRAGQIGDLIGWEKSRVSHQITRMEQRRLVTRRECGDDARGTWIVLTAEGETAVRNASRDRREAVREYFFDAMNEEERDLLKRLSLRVMETIDSPLCGAEPETN